MLLFFFFYLLVSWFVRFFFGVFFVLVNFILLLVFDKLELVVVWLKVLIVWGWGEMFFRDGDVDIGLKIFLLIFEEVGIVGLELVVLNLIVGVEVLKFVGILELFILEWVLFVLSCLFKFEMVYLVRVLVVLVVLLMVFFWLLEIEVEVVVIGFCDEIWLDGNVVLG